MNPVSQNSEEIPAVIIQECARAANRSIPQEELIGAAWEAYMDAQSRVDAGRNPPGYLRIAARNGAIDEFSQISRHKRVAKEELLGVGESMKIPDCSKDTRREDVIALFRDLTVHLSNLEKTVLYLRAVECLSYPEISKDLSKTEACVRLIFSRAKEKVCRTYAG
jgi:RNA polymerase sigma factor (sigma-70 family)